MGFLILKKKKKKIGVSDIIEAQYQRLSFK